MTSYWPQELTAEERIEMALYDFWLPPLISMAEYEMQLRLVAAEMELG